MRKGDRTSPGPPLSPSRAVLLHLLAVGKDLAALAELVLADQGIAALGGATLDNEENYLIKKLFTAMGAIQIENQARI